MDGHSIENVIFSSLIIFSRTLVSPFQNIIGLIWNLPDEPEMRLSDLSVARLLVILKYEEL